MHFINNTSESLRKFNTLFHYKNVNEIPDATDKITIYITLSKNMSLKNIVKVFALLELVTGFRPSFIRSKKSSILLKRRKGAPIGAKITLRKKYANTFLFKLLWEVLPRTKDLNLNYNLKKDLKQNSVLSFKITDPFVFSELKSFYFLFKDIGPINIVLSFKKFNSKEETFLKSRLLQMPFN
jgi:large subunit ribosomal protein L5